MFNVQWVHTHANTKEINIMKMHMFFVILFFRYFFSHLRFFFHQFVIHLKQKKVKNKKLKTHWITTRPFVLGIRHFLARILCIESMCCCCCSCVSSFAVAHSGWMLFFVSSVFVYRVCTICMDMMIFLFVLSNCFFLILFLLVFHFVSSSIFVPSSIQKLNNDHMV